MTVISRHLHTARVLDGGGDIVLSLDGGDITLDASAIPYVQSSLAVAVKDAMLLEELDPRDSRRVIVEAKRADTEAPVYTAWVEQRRNQAANPRPTSFGGSGWTAAAGLQGMAEPGWIGGTLTATTTPYIFSTTSTRAYAAGEKITLSIRYRVTGQAGAAQHISVIPHVRTGNAYYRGVHVTRPIVVGQDEDVVIQWTTVVAIAANQLDLAVVGSANAAGTGLAAADAGFGVRASRALVEDGWTAGAFFDGNSNPGGTLERTRWLGAGNASASVIESRTIDRFDPVYGPARVFNLGIRKATPNRADGTVELELASDEAVLNDFAQLVDDLGPRAYETSLRALCGYVLGKIGAVLQAGANDADVTAFWGITNLVTNPSIEVNADGWTAGTNASAVSRQPVSFDPPASGYGLRWTTGAAGISYVDYAAAAGIRVTGGRWYVFAAHMLCANSSTGHVRVHFKNDQGVTIAQVVGASVPVAGGGWTRPFVIAQAPAAATSASLHPGFQATAAGQQPYVDAVMFYEGTELVPYFDGATADTAAYDYFWSAAAHASSSGRKPSLERLPEALVWRAGVSAMAFLEVLLKAAGLRLVCDEQRRWTLRGADYRADGNQAYRYAANITTADEQLSREDDEWFDGAVYEYIWTDRDGIEQRRVDAFALTPTPTKVVRREVRDTPFPGPGRAEQIVRRAQTRGRTVTVSAIPTWTETTDQTLSVLLEGTPIQTGIAGVVRFNLADDTVTVTSRTADTDPDSWVLVPDAERWIDAPANDTWIGS